MSNVGNACPPPSTSPDCQPPILEAASIMSSELTRAEQLLGRLYERLAPTLGPGQARGEKGPERDRPGNSTIVCEFDGARCRVEAMTCVLEEILERLEV